MAIYKYVPTGPRHTFSWSAGDSYRPGQDIEASIFNTPLEESPIDRKMPSTIPSRHNSLKADLFKAYDLSTLSREAQAARQVKHMQELKNGYGVSTGPMIELLKLVCPYDLRGEPCENKPCRMWKICPVSCGCHTNRTRLIKFSYLMLAEAVMFTVH